MSGPEDRTFQAVSARLGGPGLAAAALIVVAALATASMLPGLIAAVFVPTPVPVAPPDAAAQDQAAKLDNFRKQVDGRTMFFVPAKPPPPKPAVEARNEETGPPPAPPAPTTYGGPAPIAMVFDTVWFADGQKLKAGDESKDDLQVVRLEAPWAAILKWKGVEFTVKFFERDSVVIKAPGQAMAVGTPSEAKPAVEAAAPASMATEQQPASESTPATPDPSASPPTAPPDPPADPENKR